MYSWVDGVGFDIAQSFGITPVVIVFKDIIAKIEELRASDGEQK